MSEQASWSELHWNEQGLIPAVVQDAATGDVLMMAWMNDSRCAKRSKPGRRTSGAGAGKSCGIRATRRATSSGAEHLRRLRRRHPACCRWSQPGPRAIPARRPASTESLGSPRLAVED